MLSTLLRADSGRATVCGHDVATHPAAVRSVIGVTGQFSAVSCGRIYYGRALNRADAIMKAVRSGLLADDLAV